MSGIQGNRIGSNSNPIVLSDDENEMDYESDINSYTSHELVLRRVLRAGEPDSDDEALREFDRARGQTRVDIYQAVLRPESDSEPEFEHEFGFEFEQEFEFEFEHELEVEPEFEFEPEHEPEPEPEPEPEEANHQLQGLRRSSRPRKEAYYFDMDDDDELKYELFTLEGYSESKDKSDDVSL